MIKSMYIIGSLRNPEIPVIANTLNSLGLEAFSDWFGAGPIADDSWKEHELLRGRKYAEALKGYSAKHIFEFDKYHLNRCDSALLVMPAGKSGHLELGYASGLGKPTFVLFDEEPDRWDIMYGFTEGVFFSLDAFISEIGEWINDDNPRTKEFTPRRGLGEGRVSDGGRAARLLS